MEVRQAENVSREVDLVILENLLTTISDDLKTAEILTKSYLKKCENGVQE